MLLRQRKKSDNKLIKFNKRKVKWEINIGVVIFIVFLIYLIGISITYFNEHSISTFEVTYGSIIHDTSYNGLILRNENVYSSNDSGYIQYYYSEGSKLSKDTIVYTLSSSSISTDETTSSYTISSTEQKEILSEIIAFNKIYTGLSFDDTYNLSSDIEYILNSSSNEEKLNELSDISSTNSSLILAITEETGLLAYSIDGYEGITLDTFTSDLLDKTAYSYTEIPNGDYVSTNTDIYKVIIDEEWNIIFPIADDDVDNYEELSKVTFKFTTDSEITTEDFTLLEEGDTTYGVITLNSGLVRYITQRFIDIELILDNLEGYKIPISSVAERDFYKVPIEYVTKGGSSGSDGLMIIDNGTDPDDAVFQSIDIYYKDDDYVYLWVDDIGTKKVVVEEESSNVLLLSDIVTLDGVYVVNKGYAEYKIVSILTSSSEYYIVDDSISYSIGNYDHIALYGDSVSENAIIK